MALSQTYFENSQNFSLNNVQFTNIIPHDFVSTILRESVASGAIFDSAERFPPGKCQPGTRKRVMEQITTWINDPDPAAQRILWVHGPAGSGKSAVAQTICELLIKPHPAQYGGSFFFARDSPDRGKALKLFTTLAYQLAIQFPFLRPDINDILHRDPSLPTKSMEIQLLSLITQPVLAITELVLPITPPVLPGTHPISPITRPTSPIIRPVLSCQAFSSPKPVLIIDGLDECADDEGLDTQRTIINLIARSIVEWNLPLRFIIASRPEAWIRDAFKTSPLPNITLPLSLRDDVDADRDIRAYLTHEFEKIRLDKIQIMGSVKLPWPPTNVVDHFVYEASGQYLYASTVLKFVGRHSKFTNPQEQLRILTSRGPQRASAFSELDRLYATILSAYPRWETMRCVLGGILCNATTTIIEVILGVDPIEVVLVLDALSSVIEKYEFSDVVAGEERWIQSIFGSLSACRHSFKFYHLSFREFLQSPDRSGEFYVDVVAVQKQIIRKSFDLVHRNLDQNYEKEPHSFLNISAATYHCVKKDTHKWFSQPSSATPEVHALVTCMAERLLALDPIRNQMNYLSYFLQDMEWIISMTTDCLEPHFPKEHKIKPQKLRDAASFAYKQAVSTLSGPLLATPTLVCLMEFSPSSSKAYTPIHDLLQIHGITVDDVLYTLKQQSNIMHLTTSDLCTSQQYPFWCIYVIKDLVTHKDFLYQENGEDKEWRSKGKWKDLRFFLACRVIELHRHQHYSLYADNLGKKFFGSKGISDIHNKEYFQNANSLKLLALISDISLWTSRTTLLLIGKVPDYFMSNVLCWFNRQLTNVQTFRLLNEHDKALPQKMKRVANEIFELAFLSSLRDRYSQGLDVWARVFTAQTFTPHFSITFTRIRISVLPLPRGFYLEELQDIHCPEFPESKYHENWQLFHDEVFGKEDPTRRDSVPLVIDRSRWHPYLASFLLKALVAHLYSRYDDALRPGCIEIPENSFWYIIDCLPYAQTTEQNLNAFRAIAYLFPNVTLPWHLPADFWFDSVEFLRKYDRSILSSEELNLFEGWMYSMGRCTKHYYPAVQESQS